MPSTQKITTIPYRDLSKGQEMPLLLIEPIERQSRVTANGLTISDDIGLNFEEGKVVASGADSLFSPGDMVTYKKLDRTNKNLFESVYFDNKTHDVIGESEVWSVNDFPYNRIFIEPYAEPEKTDSGLILPQRIEGVTQKGRIVSAPPNSFFKVDDQVEYRRDNMKEYFNATIDNVEAEILYEPDIYIVNGKVSPYKIIVRIDIPAQLLKRSTTESGLLRSPIFQYMLFNLQVGEVMAVGEKTEEFYPDLKEGDTAIIHHMIESEEYRLVKKEFSPTGNLLYEYRVINCLDKRHREIFGRMVTSPDFPSVGPRSTKTTRIIPYGDSVFLKWDISFLQKSENQSLSLLSIPRFEDCTNLLDLKDALSKAKAAGVLSYKEKMGGYTADIARHCENTEDALKQREFVVSKINALRSHQEKAANYVNKDHLLICEQVFPKTISPKVVCTHSHLYAINIFGQKYLIADKDFIFLTIDNMDKLHATGEKVLILPILDQSASPLLIPDAARERPQKGTVISVGYQVTDPLIKEGNTVLYRRGAGIKVEFAGEDYIEMKQGDVLAKIESIDTDGGMTLSM